MTPVWARLPVSAAPWEIESARDVILGSCRVFMGNPGHLVGTARCGPARRVVCRAKRSSGKGDEYVGSARNLS